MSSWQWRHAGTDRQQPARRSSRPPSLGSSYPVAVRRELVRDDARRRIGSRSPARSESESDRAVRRPVDLPSVTLAPNDFTHLHVHSEFSLLDGLGRITELVDAAAAAGHGLDGAHRPRRAVRRGRLLPGRQDQGHQADRRRRDLRRPAVDDVEGGQGRQPAVPPDPPGQGLHRLPATCAAWSPTRTSTATTTSRGSTASISPATARA